jgi:hypothetical protein
MNDRFHKVALKKWHNHVVKVQRPTTYNDFRHPNPFPQLLPIRSVEEASTLGERLDRSPIKL